MSDRDAHVQMTVFYSDQEPTTRRSRFNHLTDPESTPLGTDYAAVIESDVPIIVQHTRSH